MTMPTNENTAGQGGEFGKANKAKRKYSAKSTAKLAQIFRLRERLRFRPHHTYELRNFGISHPAGRVNDLEDMGYVIASDRITTVDSEGYTHVGVALYDLVSEPPEHEAE